VHTVLLILTQFRKEFNVDLIENLLGCILAACSTYMNEALFEICKLGDEITPKLAELFANKHASQQIKETVLQFFQVQVYLHRKLARTGSVSGAWKGHVKCILETVLDELNGLSYQRIFTRLL
jgi:hypothetical protein